MNTEERNQLIVDSINSGMSLSDLQQKLSSEYGENLSYLELRILASELAIDWEKQNKPKKAAPAPPPPPSQPEPEAKDVEAEEDFPEEDAAEEDFPEEEGEGHSVVTVDDTPKPQTAMSGSVVFPSGAKASWFMDRFGRLGIADLEEGAPQPTQEDLDDFQVELQKALQERTRQLQKMAENGNTQVEISPVLKPGCDINGTVVFDSGIKGEWMIMHGKLEFSMDDRSQKPSREELAAFQIMLSKKLREKGYQ